MHHASCARIPSAMIGDATNKPSIIRPDELDMEIVALLVSGKDNKQIANEVKVPLSTVQRRTRRLFEKNAVKSRIEPNYTQLGYNKGVVHLSISTTSIQWQHRKSWQRSRGWCQSQFT